MIEVVDFNDEHFIWKVDSEIFKLSINDGTLRQTLRYIFESDEKELNEYVMCLEKDVKLSLIAESVEELLDNVKNEKVSSEYIGEYFYSYEEFDDSLKAILECFLIKDEEIIKLLDWVFVVCENPNRYIVKQLMMIYGLFLCNGVKVSKKALMEPLNNNNLKLKKLINKNLSYDSSAWKKKDYDIILSKQTEFIILLENLQMNGTYEQLCHKSLNLYYYNTFSKMVDLTMFTERIYSSAKYLRIFYSNGSRTYEDKNKIRSFCERSLSLLNLEGILTREFALKKELESKDYEIVGEDEITFLNIVFEECKDSLKEKLIGQSKDKDQLCCIKVLDILLLESPYDDLYNALLDGKIKTDFVADYDNKNENKTEDYLKQEIYYYLYNLISGHEQMNAK
ncbi:hypothetical protein ACIQ6U_17600 [Lysinibacillus fusiformis]|uniref:hypothetical protein n=1 Tax=Lysinibacillus fusiformis TaxID=28031 RepID=UPI0038156EDB